MLEVQRKSPCTTPMRAVLPQLTLRVLQAGTRSSGTLGPTAENQKAQGTGMGCPRCPLPITLGVPPGPGPAKCQITLPVLLAADCRPGGSRDLRFLRLNKTFRQASRYQPLPLGELREATALLLRWTLLFLSAGQHLTKSKALSLGAFPADSSVPHTETQPCGDLPSPLHSRHEEMSSGP